MKRIFDNLKLLVASNPEKFFMNVSEYEGIRIAMFDYSLTIPNDFAGEDAFECRGSLFQVDENNEYVKTLVLPFEKFFNVHEYDFGNNDSLYATVKKTFGVDVRSSKDLLALPIKNVMVKEDGSIISAYELNGKILCKSNSSVTSDYARKAEELLYADSYLYEMVSQLVYKNKVVIFELKLTDLPIVIQHKEDSLVVLAVRDRETGEYMEYEKVAKHFGGNFVVEVKDHDPSEFEQLQQTLENTEGFVILTECGLRYKLKTQWYIDRHHRVSYLFSSARNIWETYINGDLDDCYASFSENQLNKERLDNVVARCDELYKKIIHDGVETYNSLKHLERKDFFQTLFKLRKDTYNECVGVLVETIYKKNGNIEESVKHLHEKLLKKTTISGLGISKWVI
jgi:T4 RnlA family RNA ligase